MSVPAKISEVPAKVDELLAIVSFRRILLCSAVHAPKVASSSKVSIVACAAFALFAPAKKQRLKIYLR